MARRIFTNCLNQETKAFNCSIGSIVGGGTLLIVLGLSEGLMFGLGGAVIGFTTGGWISRQWFLGNIQRMMFWYFPAGKFLIDKNIPESYHRYLL